MKPCLWWLVGSGLISTFRAVSDETPAEKSPHIGTPWEFEEQDPELNIVLTRENWDEKVAGKMVFIKFWRDGCNHCENAKKPWYYLEKKYRDFPDVLIANVECWRSWWLSKEAQERNKFCEEHEITGTPKFKIGHPGNLTFWKGNEKSAFSLIEGAEEHVSELCNPDQVELCDDTDKESIAKLMEMDLMDIERSKTDKVLETRAGGELDKRFKKRTQELGKEMKQAKFKKDADLQKKLKAEYEGLSSKKEKDRTTLQRFVYIAEIVERHKKGTSVVAGRGYVPGSNPEGLKVDFGDAFKKKPKKEKKEL